MDPLTISACAALAVIVASITFIINTMLWRHEAAGRAWSMALAAGMGGVVAEVFWGITSLTWFVVAKDLLFVYSWMLMWSGLRVTNGRTPRFMIAAIPALIAGATALFPQPFVSTPGTFLCAGIICIASILITREASTGRLRRARYARPFTVAYAGTAAYTGGLVVYGLAQPDADLREPGFFSMGSYVLVIMCIVIVAVTNATLIRAETIISNHDYGRGVPWESLSAGVWNAEAFSLVAGTWLRRAQHQSAQLAYMVLDLDDRKTISRAFTLDEYQRIVRNWRATVQDCAPPHAQIAELAPTRMALISPVDADSEAMSAADALRTGLLESTNQFPSGFHPTMSIGIALASNAGWDLHALEQSALAALDRATWNGGNDAQLGVAGS